MNDEKLQDEIAAAERDGLKRAGWSSGPKNGFDVMLEWMRYLTDIVGFQQRARIVIDYDPNEPKCRTEIFIDKDAPLPTELRSPFLSAGRDSNTPCTSADLDIAGKYTQPH